ncbi:MAG: Omp28-related outer membrane protein [Bacteroidales bacterium]|nr:Omp28-related outer membrane protein [Bacteroidales bacterium]
MKKKISFILVFALISAAAWMSCQKIDEPLKMIDQRAFPELPDDTTGGGDTLDNFITTFVDFKQVLLEDFTGHLCVNCPEAAKLAHDLSVTLNHKLVIYAVHAGNFAEPVPGTVLSPDYRTPAGNELNSNYAIFANPLALIDRTVYNGLHQIFKDDWETVVMAELQKPNTVNLKLSNTWYPDLDVVSIDLEAEFVAEPEGQYKLVVFIVEDSLVSAQLNNDTLIGGDTLYNYVHRNILRDAVSPVYGDFLGDNGVVTMGQLYAKHYTYPLSSEWLPRNCRIIAYIARTDETLNLMDVTQVAELEIKVDE